MQSASLALQGTFFTQSLKQGVTEHREENESPDNTSGDQNKEFDASVTHTAIANSVKRIQIISGNSLC